MSIVQSGIGCCFVAIALLVVPHASHSQEEIGNPDRFDVNSPESPVRETRRRSVFRLKIPNAALTPDEQAKVADNCLFGLPRKLSGADVGPTQLVYREGYVLEHSSEWKIPLWVAEHCTTAELSGSLPRTNPFRPDPLLARGERSELADYRGSGLDRGHMAPNGNQKVDDRLRRETFFLSNIVPQAGKGFNQSIWADLEDAVRDWTQSRQETWIITGGLFYDPAEENPATADGLVDVAVIGDDEVGVPTHLFKIVAAKNSAGKWEALAFVFENKSYPKLERIESHLKSIDWIEERTGFDFLPDVVAETGEAGIDVRLEAAAATALWN